MTALDDYRLLGKSGVRVSPLCLGTMTFGDNWGWGADAQESRRQFDMYADKGGNFIDSADGYTDGTSETLVGEFVADDRDRWVVATKFGFNNNHGDPNAGGNHRKNMMQSLEGSLRRMKTDYIDLYWVHIWEFRTRPEEVMRALDDAVRQGKILYIGVSNAPAWKIAQCNTLAELRGWTAFSALQMEYSLIERTAERDLIPMCAELGLGVTPWSPLAQGILAGKYKKEDANAEPEMTESGFPASRKTLMVGQGRLNDRTLGIAEAVKDVAKEIGRTPAQVALNWAATQPGISSPILGARTSEQLADNIGSLDFTMDDAHRDALNTASAIELGQPHEFGHDPMIQGMADGNTSISPPGYRVRF